ncbi:unnamed protein product [Pocillopora meandrina]|uniref:MARVEL domain-containing protein n=1 Tax=Pocillopora meandrina TaxID=46732 RepID=A0AAU9WXP3_9CNID|nr:unnamed protein product [Pocillopora meandrina]
MAVLVKTCCCGCSLRKDVLILGILGLVSCSSYQSYKYLKYPSAFHTLVVIVPGLTIFTISLAYVSLVFGVISLLVNLLFLGSCCSGDKHLVFPWLGWSIFELFFSFGVIIFYIAIWIGYDIFLVIYGIAWLLWIYFTIVVYSYIEALREDPSGTSAGFSPPLTGGNQSQMAWMPPPPYAVSQRGTV